MSKNIDTIDRKEGAGKMQQNNIKQTGIAVSLIFVADLYPILGQKPVNPRHWEDTLH